MLELYPWNLCNRKVKLVCWTSLNFHLQVKQMFAQLIAAMAHHGYLNLEGGQRLVEFIVKHCAINVDEEVLKDKKFLIHTSVCGFSKNSVVLWVIKTLNRHTVFFWRGKWKKNSCIAIAKQTLLVYYTLRRQRKQKANTRKNVEILAYLFKNTTPTLFFRGKEGGWARSVSAIYI